MPKSFRNDLTTTTESAADTIPHRKKIPSQDDDPDPSGSIIIMPAEEYDDYTYEENDNRYGLEGYDYDDLDDDDYEFESDDDFDYELDHDFHDDENDRPYRRRRRSGSGNRDDDDEPFPSRSERDTASIVDSFESYIVVSVLTATASFAALLDDSEEMQKGIATRSAQVAHNLSIVCSAICSLGGIYATVVFSFCTIYGKTAIGMGRTDTYERFLKKTAEMRKKAFYMYLLSLNLFIVLLVIAAVDKMEDRLEFLFGIFLTSICVYMYRDWSSILVEAGAIFAPPKMKEEEANDDEPEKLPELPEAETDANATIKTEQQQQDHDHHSRRPRSRSPMRLRSGRRRGSGLRMHAAARQASTLTKRRFSFTKKHH